MKEKKRMEGQKQRLLGRDPLGIKGSAIDSNREAHAFDLREIDAKREDLFQQALTNIEDEIEEELTHVDENGVDKVNWLETQRQALLAIAETKKNSGASILPTDPKFDPLLFLTLVHRNATYKELQDSTSRLSRKTDNQVERLQNLVRDNFDLFIKCSEGIDIFADGPNDSNSGNEGMQKLQRRFRALDDIAESCSDQAKKSFKPLLDNTNQVRKVQSALSLLQRVAPLLQVPSLMRQHIENADFSSVVKAYRKVLVIDKDHCDVDLLKYVRTKASESAQEARSDLELILADETSSASSLLDAIRDLSELISLLDGEGPDGEATNNPKSGDGKTPRAGSTKPGTFSIDRHVICVRDYPPAMACLLLQISHFRSLVEKYISTTEATVDRFFRGEGADGSSNSGSGNNSDGLSSEYSSSQRSRDKRWKIDVLDARVDATCKAVQLAKNWLPRLLQIGLATHEAEKRRIARKSRSGGNPGSESDKEAATRSAFELFKTMVGPALMRLHEHAAFCALGCSNQGSAYKIGATFGRSSADRLKTILQSPLPPTQTAKCALELAVLAEAIQEANDAMISIRPTNDEKAESKKNYKSPLEKCYGLASDTVVMIERRVCIYSFDACSRKLSTNASGNGTFDGASLLACVQKLSDDLTRPDECATEVEKGCVLVVTKCCEGLTSYVKDRSDAARLRVVAECADALNMTIGDVVREVSYLTNDQSETLEKSLSSVISTLEGEMFDVYLESVKRNVEACARLGLIDSTEGESTAKKKADEVTPFPPYLAASFLSIVRCRAQVERALREATVRNAEGNGATYLFLALQTASDGIVENICLELKAKLTRIRPTKADAFASHLQFLMNTLKKYLSDETLTLASDTRRMLLSKAGAKRHGPEGLSGLENLERLGRVYVMCLNE
jgi:hypothetical protein